MEKIVRQGMLFDTYGALLNDHQRKIYEDVVLYDLSLSETAQDNGISRQGVHDLIRRCDRTLEGYESRLHLLERHEALYDGMERVLELLEQGGGMPEAEQILKDLMARIHPTEKYGI